MSRFAPMAIVTLAALAAGGCLIVERQVLEFHFDSERVGSYRMEMRNVQTDAKTAEGQDDDYRDLLAMARGDDYLLDAAADGRYIRTRELKVEAGVVVGRESGLFRIGGAGEFPPLRRAADASLWLQLAPDQVYVTSNGAWQPDSAAVRWPPEARDLKLTVRTRDFRPTAGFAARLGREPTRP